MPLYPFTIPFTAELWVGYVDKILSNIATLRNIEQPCGSHLCDPQKFEIADLIVL